MSLHKVHYSQKVSEEDNVDVHHPPQLFDEDDVDVHRPSQLSDEDDVDVQRPSQLFEEDNVDVHHPPQLSDEDDATIVFRAVKLFFIFQKKKIQRKTKTPVIVEITGVIFYKKL